MKKLKKLFKDPKFLELLNRLTFDFAVFDSKGNLLFSNTSCEKFNFEREFKVEDKISGVIRCDDETSANLLEGIILAFMECESEKRELVSETLRRYRELSLIYRFSERIVSTFDIERISEIAIDEIKKIIPAEKVVVVIFGRNDEEVKRDQEVREFVDRIKDIEGAQILGSVIVCPMRVKGRDVGGIVVLHSSYLYTSEEMKLLSAITTQTGYAIENALLHEKQLEEEKLRANFGRLYIVTVIIFSAVSLMPDTSNFSGTVQMILSWGCLLTIFLPVYFMAKKMGMPFSSFGITLKNSKKSILEALVFSLILVPVVIGYKKLTAPSEPLITWRTMRNYTEGEFYFYFATYTIHCYLQEFIARGVIQGSLMMFMKDQHFLIPIVLAASIFGIAHLHISYSAAITTFAISFIFGYIYHRHRTLIGVSIIHYVLGLVAMAVGLI